MILPGKLPYCHSRLLTMICMLALTAPVCVVHTRHMGTLVLYPTGAQVAEWQGFYPTSQVSRLAQVPLRTLYEWRQRGIITPTVKMMDGDKIVEEGYTYADLTLIRLLRALREDRIDLKSAGIALRHLYRRLGSPSQGWADAQVYFVGREIYAFKPDGWDVTAATKFGQKLETRLFGDLFEELAQLEEGASILVPQQFRAFVQIDPEIMSGEPVIRGTRIPTSVVAELALGGESIKELAELYAPIPRGTIEKVIEYERYLARAA